MSEPMDAATAARAIDAIARRHGVTRPQTPSSRSSKPVQRGRPEKGVAVCDARAVRTLEKLRANRVWRGRDQTITKIVKGLRADSSRVQKRLGEMIALWNEIVPERLASRTALSSLRGGTLHVQADSSSVAYALDRELRTGLLTALRRRFRGTLGRVKVTVAARRRG